MSAVHLNPSKSEPVESKMDKQVLWTVFPKIHTLEP